MRSGGPRGAVMLPTYTRLCVYTAHACAAAILAVPVAARWFFPLEPIGNKPQGLGDIVTLVTWAILAAGRGAWVVSMLSGLVVGVMVLVAVAYLGARRARAARAERRRCLLPLLACVVAVAAYAVIDAWLPEFRV